MEWPWLAIEIQSWAEDDEGPLVSVRLDWSWERGAFEAYDYRIAYRLDYAGREPVADGREAARFLLARGALLPATAEVWVGIPDRSNIPYEPLQGTREHDILAAVPLP